MLDPAIKVGWIDTVASRFLDTELKIESVKKRITDLAIQMIKDQQAELVQRAVDLAEPEHPRVEETKEDGTAEPEAKRSRRLSLLRKPTSATSAGTSYRKKAKSARAEVEEYLADEASLAVCDYWQEHLNSFPKLTRLATRVLCVVASSSPVERVFSVGGNTMLFCSTIFIVQKNKNNILRL